MFSSCKLLNAFCFASILIIFCCDGVIVFVYCKNTNTTYVVRNDRIISFINNVPFNLRDDTIYKEKTPRQYNKIYNNSATEISHKQGKVQIENNERRHSLNINTPKSVSFVKRKPKTNLIYNITSNYGADNMLSTSELIDTIHYTREKYSKKLDKKTFMDFPENWLKILEDGKKKKEFVFFYEVPLIDKDNDDRFKEKITQKVVMKMNENVDERNFNKFNSKNFEKKKSSRIVTDDQFVFDTEISDKDEKDKYGVVSERFLNLFQVVKFNNTECYSANGVKGVCLHPLECQTSNGITARSCAEGYGICCVYQYSCGDETSSNCSTFTNPNFPKPSSERLSCTFTVHKAHPGITQLRLEIVQLELQPPTNGTCVDDQFVITGQNTNNIVPILCGINNDQHLYVDVSEAAGPFYLSAMTTRRVERLIQVRVCQLGSDDERAPQGCLQYHKSAMGVIESFNYRASGNIPATYRHPSYTNNLNYAICIRRESNRCSITYTNYDENGDFAFQILNYDSEGVPLIPPGQAGVEIFNCPDDYIVVNGIRLCGERLNDASLTEDFTLNAPVTETGAGPIVFIFRTNGNITGRGFRLNFRQNPCTFVG